MPDHSLWRRHQRGRPPGRSSKRSAGPQSVHGANGPSSGPQSPRKTGQFLKPACAAPDLEAQLRAGGFTLGHYPQSFDYSSLGGWVATRSSGQQSAHFGRIEDLFAGGELISPEGNMTLAPYPASAAGPDLRHLVLGSEGRLGIISKAVVRITHLPENDDVYGVFFPDWESGLEAVREVAQSGLPLFHDPDEQPGGDGNEPVPVRKR